MSIEICDPEDPRLPLIHAKRIMLRDIDQLLGICEVALQDGVVDEKEAQDILYWLHNRQTCLDAWPANVLFDRLRAMLADGRLDDDERSELLSLVTSIVPPRLAGGELQPTALPLDCPPPPVVFDGRSFCFTGVFDYGRRNDCQEAVLERGGIAAAGVTKKLDYLVIGSVGSEVWKHTSFGLKIAKAVDLQEHGAGLAIISEMHWARHL